MSRISSIIQLFYQGYRVSRPGAWKNTQILASLLLAIVGALSYAGIEITITGDQANDLAVALIALLNGVFTVITSNKVGLPSERKSETPESNQSRSEEPGSGHDLFNL